MHIQSAIEQLGYSPHEAKVYLTVLALGESTATEIAEKAQVPRTTVNLVIDSLHKKGLLNAYLQHRRKMWSAQNPDKLLIRLKEREAALKTILPTLHSLRHDAGAKLTARTYSGAEEIKQIMRDLLETKRPILAIHSWDDWVAFLGIEYMDDFVETRVHQHLPVRILVPKTALSIAHKARDAQELRTTAFLPDSAGITNSIFIYGHKVAIISITTKNPVGILIADEQVHHTMEVLFESLWEQSSET